MHPKGKSLGIFHSTSTRWPKSLLADELGGSVAEWFRDAGFEIWWSLVQFLHPTVIWICFQ